MYLGRFLEFFENIEDENKIIDISNKQAVQDKFKYVLNSNFVDIIFEKVKGLHTTPNILSEEQSNPHKLVVYYTVSLKYYLDLLYKFPHKEGIMEEATNLK